MAVHFLTNSLDKWDAAEGDALALSIFSDERPLRGAAGLADWRLCGQLSRLIKLGKLSGERGETLMLPPRRRLAFPRLLLFGLGNSAEWSEASCAEQLRWIREVLRRAKVTRYALQVPGRSMGMITPRRALELWFEASGAVVPEEEISVIDDHAAHKDMVEVLRRHQRAAELLG